MLFSASRDRAILDVYGGAFFDYPQIKEQIQEALDSNDEMQISRVATKVLNMVRDYQSQHRSAAVNNDDKPEAIPAEHMTRIMSKKEAAKFHNKGGVANPTDYFNGLIKKEMLTPPSGSGRRWQFDKRNFPQDDGTQKEIS